LAKKFIGLALAPKIEVQLTRNYGPHANLIGEVTAGTDFLTLNVATMCGHKQQAVCHAKQQ
jgi:hypothetical protein